MDCQVKSFVIFVNSKISKRFSFENLYPACESKTIKTCQNQHVDFLRFLFTVDSLKIEKNLGLVSRTHLL